MSIIEVYSMLSDEECDQMLCALEHGTINKINEDD